VSQVRKEHVRQAFVAAAAETFAEQGYAATSMADVAARAGSSIGNLYKYFPSKQELFEAAVPRQLVRELARRTRARMRALGDAKDVRELGADAQYHALAGELLDYCLAHRAAVVVVLKRAEGTRFAGFADGFVSKLTSWALDYARGAYPTLVSTPELLFALRHAYRNFIATIAEALRAFPGDVEARAVIALLTSQHQAGLKRLFETQGEPHANSPSHRSPPLVSTAVGPRAGDAEPAGPNPGPAGPRARQAHRARRPRRLR
jgi:AcrR family transcriptional regulator